jgi:hypothetical protein
MPFITRARVAIRYRLNSADAIPPVPAVDGQAGCTDLDLGRCRSRWSHSEEAN